jgi:mono/diheme cytochrome c family protein
MKQNSVIKSICWIVLIAVAPVLTGCGESGSPRFHANLVQMAYKNISPKHEQQIADILTAMFGTPDEPFVLPESGLDLQKIRHAAGPVQGYTQGLFRLHCVHCHGITGDGMGPTAEFLKPYPRDYREGWYKFKSTPSNWPPTHDDLVHTLHEGVNGTAMPSFKLLPQGEIDSLVEYIRYLSLRGQTELALIKYCSDEVDGDADMPTTKDVLIDGDNMFGAIVEKWKTAESQVTQVPPPPADFGSEASIKAGHDVFYGKGACVKCHGPTALGDGQLVFDMWNEEINNRWKDVKKPDQDLPELKYALNAASLPPRESQPRNLRQGIFRGGRQPYEIFFRLYNGIYPSQMPGVAQTAGMTTDDIWHLVDFVLDLPYQPGSQYHTDAHMEQAPRERL